MGAHTYITLVSLAKLLQLCHIIRELDSELAYLCKIKSTTPLAELAYLCKM